MTIEEKITAIYKKIPPIKCKKKCWGACGIIGLSPAERENIISKLGYDPFELDGYKKRNCLTCPLLDAKKKVCTQYELRPSICRIYGVVKKLRCEHGCRPKRWMSDKE